MTRFLSVPLADDVPADPPFQRVAIECVDHDQGAVELAGALPGLGPAELPEGKGWAIERVQVTHHDGTHRDAPWHHHPTMDGGAPAMTIDQVPSSGACGPGPGSTSGRSPTATSRPAQIDAELERIGHVLAQLDIVLCATRARERYGHEDYVHAGCGFGRAGRRRLHRRVLPRGRRARLRGLDTGGRVAARRRGRSLTCRCVTPAASSTSSD